MALIKKQSLTLSKMFSNFLKNLKLFKLTEYFMDIRFK